MRTQQYICFVMACLLAGGLSSCKKDSAKASPDVFYSIALDGYTVTFTNETSGASTYKWDFGDGTSSDEESPSHTYPGKGKYVPTLYATSSDGTTAEGSTVINISKSSAIKLDDNTLADWDTVSYNTVTPGANGGVAVRAKYDYSSDFVYCYYEITGTVAEANVFDFYLDADNNPSTGYLSWMYPGAGNDIVLEGSLFPGGWFDPLYFTGGTNQSGWSWAGQSIAEFYELGAVVQDGPTLKFEVGLKRAKLKNLAGTAIRIGMSVTKSDWSAIIGSVPGTGTISYLLDMSE